jgi:hypothetical protein
MNTRNRFRFICPPGALAIACSAPALAAGLISGPARAADAVLGPEAAKPVPIADAHFHVMVWMDVRELAGYMDRNGIRGGWRQLIEDDPDRFAVGLDIPQTWNEYDAIVRAIRVGLLAHLSPATAERVACRNAQAWFGLE